MKTSRNIPKFRFDGFTDAWEQRKLGLIFEEFSKKSKEENEYPVLSSTNTGMEPREGRVSGKTNVGYKIIETGDLVLSPQNLWLGNININNLGTGLVSPSYKTYKIRKLISDFLKPQLKTDRMIAEYKYASTQGASVVRRNLDLDRFNEIQLSIPGTVEQQSIGTFFSTLDHLITLQQRELDYLKETKKTMLSELFPKKSETIPGVRFDGFTDAWEQRKLGEVGKTQSGIGFPDSEQGGKLGVPFFKVSDMNNIGNDIEMINSNNYVSKEQISQNRWKPISELPAIIFAKVGAAIMLNRKRLVNTPFLIDNNTMAYKFGKEWNAKFGITLFETIYLPGFAQVGALPSYNSSDIEAIKISLPSISEQQSIGSFFSTLDHLITLQQRKLDLLESQKQTLLKSMFPR